MATRKEGMTSGDGNVSPLGNTKGAPQSGAISGKPTDFTASPTSQYGKGATPRDYTVDPGPPDAPPAPGRDLNAQPPMPTDPGPHYNPESVPIGGKTLFADPSPVQRSIGAGTYAGSPKPFKLK